MTFGEYVRRLRRENRWTLQQLADATGLSYFRLSRLENDSAVPDPATVTKLATALGGDLKRMLELADTLPREILDRMVAGEVGSSLRRTGPPTHEPQDAALGSGLRALAAAYGLDDEEALEAEEALHRFLSLPRRKRKAMAELLKALDAEGTEADGAH
ncbi:MAG TPA: helix-turn-helix transcriptional regulator [Dehalococcoidia bacterium]|nr:helix-turn-helix transcriptional regulator [Dehalococcoidia bacterium]